MDMCLHIVNKSKNKCIFSSLPPTARLTLFPPEHDLWQHHICTADMVHSHVYLSLSVVFLCLSPVGRPTVVLLHMSSVRV